MKNQVIKRLKKTLAAVLTVSMLAGISMIASAEAGPESGAPDVIKYTKYTDYATYMGSHAPEEIDNDTTGGLFAGWFQKDGDVYKPLENASQVTNSDEVYAKFVPAQMLGVKVQNKAGTKLGEGSTALKVLTGIDSLNYKNVGFELSVVLLSEDGKTWVKEVSMGEDVKVQNVYWTLKSGSTTYKPVDLFGTDAAKYFGTTWVKNIGYANYDKIICIKPYIETLDGVRVDGLTKYAHVEDGLEVADREGYRWVNVPINVRDTQGVAAGVLKLAKESNGWDCVEVECGKLFQEMDYAIKSDESVKLVGNLSDMREDAQANTIYANVRFQVAEDDLAKALTGYTFSITEEDFANVAETQYTTTEFPVWDVKY